MSPAIAAKALEETPVDAALKRRSSTEAHTAFFVSLQSLTTPGLLMARDGLYYS